MADEEETESARFAAAAPIKRNAELANITLLLNATTARPGRQPGDGIHGARKGSC